MEKGYSLDNFLVGAFRWTNFICKSLIVSYESEKKNNKNKKKNQKMKPMNILTEKLVLLLLILVIGFSVSSRTGFPHK